MVKYVTVTPLMTKNISLGHIVFHLKITHSSHRQQLRIPRTLPFFAIYRACNKACHVEGRIEAEGVRKQGAEEDIWA